MATGFTFVCTLIVLLTTYAFLIDVTGAGQICASCTGLDGTEDCLHYPTCNNDEVCYMTAYTVDDGHMLHDYGCSSPLACHHSVEPGLVGRRSDDGHVICNVCCNSTHLCNIDLACDSTGIDPSNPPRECSELNLPTKKNGTYTIYPYSSLYTPVSVYCVFDSAGTGWTVIQRRFDGSVNFYRNWHDYKTGFGTAQGEYWLGNEVIHQLTTHDGTHLLKIVMSDFAGVTKYAEYSPFSIGDEGDGFQLRIQHYSGNAGDGLARHNGRKFSTLDRDNDASSDNCAQLYKGGWWYNYCHTANLNGLYLSGSHSSYADGINWYPWHGYHYSLKDTMMMIRKS